MVSPEESKRIAVAVVEKKLEFCDADIDSVEAPVDPATKPEVKAVPAEPHDVIPVPRETDLEAELVAAIKKRAQELEKLFEEEENADE